MESLPFYIVDVFAESKFTGNQLAVFRHAAVLSSEEMLQLTREMNYSESTFILSDEMKDGGFDVRIFTPGGEVPFAGHPTLGTAFIIREEILKSKAEKIILNLKVGPIPVIFNDDGNSWMLQNEPVFGLEHDTKVLAEVLGLEAADIDDRFPIQEISTGFPFFIVPLKNIAALKTTKVNRDAYYNLVNQTEAKGILIFSPETNKPENDLAVRVFVEYLGVPEDPATGSGNGCLAAYLTRHQYFGKPAIDVRVEQGYEMGRPSLLLLRTDEKDGKIEVNVGGKSVLVARGELA